MKSAPLLTLLTGSLLLAPSVAFSQDSSVKPHMPLEKTIGQVTSTGPVPSLAVVNSAGATLNGTKLTLTGVAANVIVFADRPVRAAGHVTTEQFIKQWDADKDSFAADPPNATVSMLGGDGSQVSDAVVTLKSPRLAEGTLTFDVAVLEGSLNGATGPAALFIDPFAARFGGFHAGGFEGARVGGVGAWHGAAWGGGRYWHAPVYRGAWYGAGAGAAAGIAAGAAVGAAYNSYVVPHQCGYYPYSPCD